MKRLAVAVVVWLLSTPLFAAGPPPVYGWSGWYAGLNFGYGFGSNNIHLEPESPGAINARSGFVSHDLGVSPKGLLGGVQFGKNWQQGTFVYGFESDLAYAGIRDDVTGPFLLVPFNFWTAHTQNLDWFGTLRARAGVAVSDRALIFLSGGLAYGQAELFTFGRTPLACVGTNFCVIGQTKEWRAGWTAGAGLEYVLAGNWSAKFDYLYYDLGKIENTVLDINPAFFQAPPGPDTYRGSARINGNIVRIGVNYKLGGIITAP